ncbi:MAG: hypothetical protein ABIL09_14335 [Gemmatimonadota bacterium]
MVPKIVICPDCGAVVGRFKVHMDIAHVRISSNPFHAVQHRKSGEVSEEPVLPYSQPATMLMEHPAPYGKQLARVAAEHRRAHPTHTKLRVESSPAFRMAIGGGM